MNIQIIPHIHSAMNRLLTILLCLISIPSLAQNQYKFDNNRYKELSILEGVQQWIEFRENCITRVYQYRLDKDLEKEHLLSTWDHIKNDIHGVVQMISNNTEAVAKANLMSTYNLDEIQAEYLLDMKIRSITKDRAEKSLKE